MCACFYQRTSVTHTTCARDAQAKLKWINGQHLRAMPVEAFAPIMEEALLRDVVIGKADAKLISHVAGMVQEKSDLVNDAATILSSCLDYELSDTAKSCEEAAGILGDDFAALAGAGAESVSTGEFPVDMTAESFDKGFTAWIHDATFLLRRMCMFVFAALMWKWT